MVLHSGEVLSQSDARRVEFAAPLTATATFAAQEVPFSYKKSDTTDQIVEAAITAKRANSDLNAIVNSSLSMIDLGDKKVFINRRILSGQELAAKVRRDLSNPRGIEQILREVDLQAEYAVTEAGIGQVWRFDKYDPEKDLLRA